VLRFQQHNSNWVGACMQQQQHTAWQDPQAIASPANACGCCSQYVRARTLSLPTNTTPDPAEPDGLQYGSPRTG
jgi:hypothetical protein